VDHDRILTILGFAPPDFVSHIKDDYTAPVSQLIQDVFLAISKSSVYLESLGHFDIGDEQDMSAKPLWVSNWLWTPRLEALPTSYASGGGDTRTVIYDHGDDMLTVYGMLSRQVRCIAMPAPMEGDCVPVLQEWEEITKRSSGDNARMAWDKNWWTFSCADILKVTLGLQKPTNLHTLNHHLSSHRLCLHA